MSNEEYIQLIVFILKRIKDNKMLESIFYVIQKIAGTGL